MKNRSKRQIKRVLTLLCAGTLAFGCSSSGNELKKKLDEAQQKAQETALSATEGVYASGCVETVFKNAYRLVEMTLDGSNLTYKTSEYATSECQNEQESEVLVGSLALNGKLNDGVSAYTFSIPIDENVSALKLINIKEIPNGLLVSDFYYNDDEAAESFNSPMIELFYQTVD